MTRPRRDKRRYSDIFRCVDAERKPHGRVTLGDVVEISHHCSLRCTCSTRQSTRTPSDVDREAADGVPRNRGDLVFNGIRRSEVLGKFAMLEGDAFWRHRDFGFGSTYRGGITQDAKRCLNEATNLKKASLPSMPAASRTSDEKSLRSGLSLQIRIHGQRLSLMHPRTLPRLLA